jgi:hypothetical protein
MMWRSAFKGDGSLTRLLQFVGVVLVATLGFSVILPPRVDLMGGDTFAAIRL